MLTQSFVMYLRNLLLQPAENLPSDEHGCLNSAAQHQDGSEGTSGHSKRKNHADAIINENINKPNKTQMLFFSYSHHSKLLERNVQSFMSQQFKYFHLPTVVCSGVFHSPLSFFPQTFAFTEIIK